MQTVSLHFKFIQMKSFSVDNPVKMLSAISLEKHEAKENLNINLLAKKEIRKKIKEKLTDLIIYISFDAVYFKRYKKRKQIAKKQM